MASLSMTFCVKSNFQVQAIGRQERLSSLRS
jgi:hypothetical protein